MVLLSTQMTSPHCRRIQTIENRVEALLPKTALIARRLSTLGVIRTTPRLTYLLFAQRPHFEPDPGFHWPCCRLVRE